MEKGSKTPNKTEFIKMLRDMAECLESGGFYTGYIRDSFVFGNKNYGSITINMGDLSCEFKLYNATEEERKYADEQDARGECKRI